MFECVAHMVLADHMYGRTFVPPLGEPGYTRVLSPSRHPYKTLDGWLCVLIYNDRHWQSFFRLVKREDLYADPRFASMRSRNDHIDELYGIVADTLRDRTSAEWIVLLQSVDIPVAPMNSLDNLLDDQHLASVGFFETAQHPTEGTINTMRTPITWSESKPQYRYAAPNLGEHCVEVLRENGFSSSEIESLTHAGVFGAAVSQV